MPIARCSRCRWEQERFTAAAADKALDAHVALRHPQDVPPAAVPTGPRDGVPQLDGVRFQEAFLAFVRAMPLGRQFTTAELHGQIPDPPDHHHWGRAQSAAAHMGLIRPVDAQRSTLPTTKGSRLLRWVRVDEFARAR